MEMKAYSEDLRERVIAAWQEGKTQAWIAATYRISTGSIKRYIRRYKATGRVTATVQRHQAPRISREYEPALRALVAREPLAKLDWYCAQWQRETGIVMSIKTMSRMLVRMGLRQKNDGGRTGA
jgi:transposase